MKRFRSRSDSPSTVASEFEISGYLMNAESSLVSRIFENTPVSRALSRLKSRKKFWYILEEGKCRLLYYKTDSDAKEGKEPLGAINVRGAAISLALEENNQFVIHSEGKEHVLVADNHESMMLWVLALQAKQDSTDVNSECVQMSDATKLKKETLLKSDFKMENGRTKKIQDGAKAKIMRTHSLQLQDKTLESRNEKNQHNPLIRMRSLLTTGHMINSEFHLPEKDRSSVRYQLSTVTQSFDTEEDENEPLIEEPNTAGGHSTSNSSSNSSSTTTSPVRPTCGTSNVNQNDAQFSPGSPSPKSNNDNPCVGSTRDSSDTESGDDLEQFPPISRSNATATGNNQLDSCCEVPTVSPEKIRLLRKMNSEGIRVDELIQMKDRTSSLSGASVSSDSAVGTSECAHSVKLHELESELMSAKCDLAKALNRESSYKNLIEQKVNLVTELEDRLKLIEDVPEELGKPSPSKTAISNGGNSVHKLQEKCRILQNHNRFLNEEVLKLSKMLQQEQGRSHLKQLKIQRMGRENDQLKRDYVFLLQSSLRITNTDGPETMEVFMYGEDRHKERVLALLEEAKKINPTLPAYENLTRGVCHVDPLGFRRQCADEGLVLHYICRQLHQHYSTLSPAYELHQQQWKRYLRQQPTLHRTKELKTLVRGGIPAHLRSRAWELLYKSKIHDVMEGKGSHYYSYLCSLAPDDERVSQHKRQIALDLLRTMPDNIRFSDSNADGVRKMQEVLQAFCVHNPSLGYCQGMNFLVGMCLLFLEPEDAFWCLVAITERYFTPNYFDSNLIGAQADQEVLKDLLREKMPVLWRHLARLDIELCTVTLNWFLAVFFDCVPFETLLRIWDCFLLEGSKVLFRFALAILKLNEKSILARHDTVSIMRQLKAAAKLCFDVDSLFKTAFEGLRPFSRRQDIAAKQACYYKTQKEHAKKIEMEKNALKDKERMLTEMEILNANQLVIECAAVYDKDKLWLCHGHQKGAQISKVNCEENIMYRLNIELESRVMCMHSLDDDTMLLGTLSHFVHAYSTRARRLMWETRLNDSVLALGSHEEEDGIKQVFAGLADGTIAVIENVKGLASKPETFYIMIGSSPVTCICRVDRRLWCGSGNRVIILSARTLDTIDQFQTSASMLDYISMLVPEEQGVWITIRGSSVLQLWDSQTLVCKLLFDVRDNRYPRPLKQQDDEANVNQARITAVLPFGGSVLVGTAEGILIIYDIVTRISRSTSSADFGSRRQMDTTSVDHIQERIQELLLEQKRKDEADESNYCKKRNRTDSGYYTTPPMNPSSRRESQHVPSDFLPAQLEDEENEQETENSPEDRSEATTTSTVFRIGENLSVTSPESQLCCEPVDSSADTPQTQPDDVPLTEKTQRSEADRDSGRSSTSTQEKLGDDVDHVTSEAKKLCTCHQLSSKTVKCRHCLLETSEALRQLFSKYSLGTTQTNHVDSSLRCQTILNTSKILRSEICGPVTDYIDKVCNGKVARADDIDYPQSKGEGLADSSSEDNGNSLLQPQEPQVKEETQQNNDKNITATLQRNKRKFDASLDYKSWRKNSLFRAVSADDVTRWVKSQENLSSSFASDSYDFDDVFVAYTEDEGERLTNWVHHPVRSGVYRSKETEALLESIRARSLSRRRSSNICDYTIGSSSYGNEHWPSPWCSGKSRSSSPWIDTSGTSGTSTSLGLHRPSLVLPPTIPRPRLLDVRSQLPSWNLNSESEGSANPAKAQTAAKSEDTSPNEWLSYEDSNTENDSSARRISVVNKDLLHLGEWSSGTQKGSDTASNISFCSTDIPYTFELNLQEKIKISDKPIKCLLETRCGGEPTIISCAGCYGDDEAVLKWTKLGDEKLWTNDPIIEVCPYTNAIKPSPYVRSRLPRRTASLASMTTDTDYGQRTTRISAMSTPSSVVGSGLAKVQNMFLRVHDKV